MRSALFVPADRSRAIEKAKTIGADILVLDLEDAVADERKAEARENVEDAIKAYKDAGIVCAIRVSEPGSDAFTADLKVFKATKPDAVVLSKLQSMEDLRGARAQLNGAGYSGAIWSMIETPRGIMGLEAMIDQAALLNLEMVMVGINDLALTMKIPNGPDQRTALEPHYARVLLAARAAGIPVLDGVFNSFKDSDGFTTDCEIGRAMGFDGKTLIHPDQVAIANSVFAPGDEEIDWAKDVVAAYERPENHDKGAISIKGEMVERLHLETAKAILNVASNLERS
jgi:citrate lyase beta subunit